MHIVHRIVFVRFVMLIILHFAAYFRSVESHFFADNEIWIRFLFRKMELIQSMNFEVNFLIHEKSAQRKGVGKIQYLNLKIVYAGEMMKLSV